MSKDILLSDDEWVKKYNPICGDEGERFYETYVSDSYEDDFEALKKKATELAGGSKKEAFRHVWTRVDGDSGKLILLNGYHMCNRLDYCLTKEPWGKDGLEIKDYNDIYIEVTYE